MNITQLKELLTKERLESFDKWQTLELPTFNSDYDEDYEDTQARLIEHGYLSALEYVLELLKEENN